jgi:RHS repeat-associated protein
MRYPISFRRSSWALVALLLVGGRPASAQSGPCPTSSRFTGVVTEDGPPRMAACLFDQQGRIQAAIVEGGRLPVPTVVIFSNGSPFRIPEGALITGLPTIELDAGPAPRNFEMLMPAVREKIASLVDGVPSPQARPGPTRTVAEPPVPEASDWTALARYEYDAFGRVRTKIGEEGVRHYVYDGDSDRVLAEYDASGNEVASYTRAGDRLESITRAGVGSVYPTFDGLGSVDALVNAEGAVVARNQYDALGNFRLREEAIPHLNSYAFTGHRWEETLGLYQAKARFYDPALGRFTTQDTLLGEINSPASLHRYMYALDNPLRFTDPTGHQSVGADYCRAYSCSDAVRRQVDPLFAMTDRANQVVATVGGGVAIGLAWLFQETLGNPGHNLTPAGQARWEGAVPKPANTAEALIASGVYIAGVAAPAVSRMVRETPVEAGPALAPGPGSVVAPTTPSALKVPADGIVIESHTQVAPPPTRVSTRLPDGLTAEQFEFLSQRVATTADSRGLGRDLVVHGSRAGGTARPTSDLDIAIRMDDAAFRDQIAQRFGTPNAGSAKERTMLRAIDTGKIQAGEAGLRPLRRDLQRLLGLEVDVSIVRRDGPFDQGPAIPLRPPE